MQESHKMQQKKFILNLYVKCSYKKKKEANEKLRPNYQYKNSMLHYSVGSLEGENTLHRASKDQSLNHIGSEKRSLLNQSDGFRQCPENE